MASHCDFVAGVFAGACNMFISHPLDTVKTNMQSRNIGFFEAAKVLFKTEGVSAICQKLYFQANYWSFFEQVKTYYRGLLFPLCTTGFLNSIVFGVYGNSFRIFQNMWVERDESLIEAFNWASNLSFQDRTIWNKTTIVAHTRIPSWLYWRRYQSRLCMSNRIDQSSIAGKSK